jgi:hypothetical protein
MKILRLNNKPASIGKDEIQKMGETIYQNQDVGSVSIQINFKDGTTLIFDRDEAEDRFNRLMEERNHG